jgi:formamidopyrimidine-DNA glycosylase
MPELPDITVYVERLTALCRGRVLERIRVASPFVVRSVEPPLCAANGRRVVGFRRIGKRIVWVLEPDAAGPLFVVVHLMIAGRFKQRDAGAPIPKKVGLASFDVEHTSVLLTEVSPKKRASIHLVCGEDALAAFDRGGLEVLDATRAQFVARLLCERHTLKRALTDPRLFSGIGNAYSDEILHHARLSPVRLTTALDEHEQTRLYESTHWILHQWIQRLRAEAGDSLPEKVTAFRDGMAVHGRYRQPCPDCQSPIQRIAYADNETNYCARCQNAGRLLADRSLSRLMKDDWPRTLEELEEIRGRAHRSR